MQPLWGGGTPLRTALLAGEVELKKVGVIGLHSRYNSATTFHALEQDRQRQLLMKNKYCFNTVKRILTDDLVSSKYGKIMNNEVILGVSTASGTLNREQPTHSRVE